jgi:hypothetical protein
MSLKFFHLFFIAIAFLLAVFCSWWAFAMHAAPAFAWLSAAAAAGLIAYGAWFVRKARRIII